MTPSRFPIPSPLADDVLDRLFLECAELETLIVSIRQALDALDPAVESGRVTAEHLMNLAFRIENAEHGLIAAAHQIDDTATTMIRRRRMDIAYDPSNREMAVADMSGWAKN